jgi:hypothetical protein
MMVPQAEQYWGSEEITLVSRIFARGMPLFPADQLVDAVDAAKAATALMKCRRCMP